MNTIRPHLWFETILHLYSLRGKNFMKQSLFSATLWKSKSGPLGEHVYTRCNHGPQGNCSMVFVFFFSLGMCSHYIAVPMPLRPTHSSTLNAINNLGAMHAQVRCFSTTRIKIVMVLFLTVAQDFTSIISVHVGNIMEGAQF